MKGKEGFKTGQVRERSKEMWGDRSFHCVGPGVRAVPGGVTEFSLHGLSWALAMSIQGNLGLGEGVGRWGPRGQVGGYSLSDHGQPGAMVVPLCWRAVPGAARRTQGRDGVKQMQPWGPGRRTQRLGSWLLGCSLTSLAWHEHLASSMKRQGCLQRWISLQTLMITEYSS